MNSCILDLSNMSVTDTKRFNEIYTELKYEYVRLIDDLSQRRNSIYWWATPISSRCWYLSDSLRRIAIAILGIERIRVDREIKKVYCPTKDIASVLIIHCRKQHRKVHIIVKCKDENASLRKNMSLFKQMVADEYTRYQQINAALMEVRATKLPNDCAINLVDTYVRASQVEKNGYEERYFTDLLKYTDQKVYFMPQLYLNSKVSLKVLIKRIAKKAKYKYIFREQYLKKSDYWKMLLYPSFCIGFCIGKKYMRDVDVTPIINRDIIAGIVSGNSVYAMLNYYTMNRMKQQGIRIDRLIGWYEGQSSSNSLFLGYNRNYPRGKSIGYVGFAADANSIQLAPSKCQRSQKAVPKKVAVIAECFGNVPRQFVADTEVIFVPGLRIQDCWKQSCEQKKHIGKRILLALPYGQKDAKNILEWMKRKEAFFRENKIGVDIKNHPCFVNNSLHNYGIRELNCDYRFVTGSFEDAVHGVDMIITAHSTTGYETALYGKPIIFLNFASELNISCMPGEWQGTRYDVAYDPNELEVLIQKYLGAKLDRINYDDEKFFVKATNKTVARLFEDKCIEYGK